MCHNSQSLQHTELVYVAPQGWLNLLAICVIVNVLCLDLLPSDKFGFSSLKLAVSCEPDTVVVSFDYDDN